MLKLEGVEKRFGDLKVLSGVDLSLEEGERIVILGPSGCGKTTLLRITAGTLREDSGKVERNFSKLGFVFQSPTLVPWLTVLENLLLVGDDEEKAKRTLEAVGLKGFETAFPRNLSGGMRQRVNLARALLVDPDLVLFDEPFSSLDIPIKRKLMGDVSKLQKELGFSMVTVTHDLEEALNMGDRILLMSKRPSKIVAEIENTGERSVNELISLMEKHFI